MACETRALGVTQTNPLTMAVLRISGSLLPQALDIIPNLPSSPSFLVLPLQALDEIDAGICDGLTYEAIAATMPEEYAARAKNKVSNNIVVDARGVRRTGQEQGRCNRLEDGSGVVQERVG